MEKTKDYLLIVLDVAFLLVFLDAVILIGMLLGVMTGGSVEHIPFWDAQFKFLFQWIAR